MAEDPAQTVPEEPEEAPPPREEIKIKDLGATRVCNVCGKEKAPHIQFEVDGVLEYTCKSCYEGEVVEIVACRSCGAALEAVDQFCGKCGTVRRDRCPSCGAPATEADKFCGKCGADLTSPAS